jgi:hypothetical protein
VQGRSDAIHQCTTREKTSLKGKALSVSCILFDLDGTLYDSPEYSERLEVEAKTARQEFLKLLDEALCSG